MTTYQKNIVLVGMPGSGKSTLGVLLAKELGLEFVDTDLLIQVREGQTLQEILDQNDYLFLRAVEESVLLEVDCAEPKKVIATGGSAVYSDSGMRYLKQHSVVIYLNVGIEELRRRIHNYDARGIARRPDQSFESLLEERDALYKKYADITLTAETLMPSECVDRLIQLISNV
ncbi:shikimate kinase [Marinibactrum halimedae]|uniref:Shikimate kinase n=1 Tax=Marinibactrum halimedae TaxID=1444977 RepID=A0AA37T2M2_9GAMM|nr:shikimate kinase [Marinibactrum halimedae]MCD9458769.1 shikimate kinase [Marinibactrum halimedae]GLS25328.1 shikimate kinase [Marinibactrum halimedae]